MIFRDLSGCVFHDFQDLQWHVELEVVYLSRLTPPLWHIVMEHCGWRSQITSALGVFQVMYVQYLLTYIYTDV